MPTTISEIEGRRFDAAMRGAEFWREDARSYIGARRDNRVRNARRMEEIAARIVGRVSS